VGAGLLDPGAYRPAWPNSSRTNSRGDSGSGSRSRGRQSLSCSTEPGADLDVSIRTQILNLLRDRRPNSASLIYLLSLTIIYLLSIYRPQFIAADFAGVAHMSYTIAVMYLGRLSRAAMPARSHVHRSAPMPRLVLGGVVEPPRRATRGDHSFRRGAEPARPAIGLSHPSALPPRDGPLRHGRARAHRYGKPTGRLPPLRHRGGARADQDRGRGIIGVVACDAAS
jgi:hypothetical protein